jgi:type I phosphodiesterase/nucleotide pyrophosphatase
VWDRLIPRLLAGLAAACMILPPAGTARATGKDPAGDKGARLSGGFGEAPKLVAILAVDQLRADYPDRFRRFFGDRGFNRLSREGRVFKEASYSHAVTMTGPGHAVIGSGIYPDRSGIVENRWYSYELGADINCTSGMVREGAPEECAPEGSGEKEAPGMKRMTSPCNLSGMTLAERVKKRYPKARVVGVSVKDRAAILVPGKKADAAYWVEEKSDRTLSLACSRYYPGCRSEVLSYAREEGLGEKPGASGSSGLFRKHPEWREWKWSLPVSCDELCPEDLPEAHAQEGNLGKRFPHPVQDAASILTTPYGNDFVEALAERAVEVHGLGKNPAGAPDILTVSFSSTDYFGHLFGPDSCETADGMKRLDASLGRLLDFLAARVGKEHLLVVLTADHGVAPLPEVSLKKGIPAGRLDLQDSADRRTGKVGELPAIRQRMEYFLAGVLGESMNAQTPLARSFVVTFHEPHLYLNRERIGSKALSLVRSRLKDYLLHMEGIREVYTWDEIRSGKAPEPVLRSFRADRAGDLFLVLAPYWIPLSPGEGTTHGQPYDYDAHVPLMVWGSRVAPGSVGDSVDVAQIAPTIASVLGLEMSGFSRPSPLPLSGGR